METDTDAPKTNTTPADVPPLDESPFTGKYGLCLAILWVVVGALWAVIIIPAVW